METTFLTTVSLEELVDLTRKEFLFNQKMVKPNAGQLFITDNIAKGQGNTKRYDEVDTQTFGRRKREGEAAKKAAVGIGYNVTMTKERFAMEIDISQEMRDENRNLQVGQLITSLGHYLPQRRELDLTHILTFASATSYVNMDGDTVTLTVGDGLALCYAAHTTKFSDETYRNRVSGDPIASPGAIRAADKLAVTDVMSNFGERRVMDFNTIITGDDPNTVQTVEQIQGSTGDIGAAHSGVKNTTTKRRHIILPYLASTATGARDSTKERYFFIASTGKGMDGWQAFLGIWEPAHFKDLTKTDKGSNHDYSRDIWTFGVREGRGIRVATGRGIIGSLPTS